MGEMMDKLQEKYLRKHFERMPFMELNREAERLKHTALFHLARQTGWYSYYENQVAIAYEVLNERLDVDALIALVRHPEFLRENIIWLGEQPIG